MGAPLLHFEAITKTFAGVTALDAVSLSIHRGECHALMGENGAGKSTLAKILAGIHRPDAGHVLIDAHPVHFRSPRDAAAAGVAMVHQELAFCPDLSVAENLALGRYPRKLGLFVDRRAMRARAAALLAEISAILDVDAPLASLSTAQEQLVQIAAAVGAGARVLIFDEPTSSLSEPEAQRLFALIGRLKARGVTMIYVSHRLPEVFALCDRLSVLRDGRFVATLDRTDATPDRVVEMMIGRTLAPSRPRHLDAVPAQVMLNVRGLASPAGFHGVSFNVRAGEVVGLAGLIGSGRSQVAQAVFGLDRRARGQVEIAGQPLPIGSIRAAMRRGVGLVPEDRKRQGLVLQMGCRENFTLPSLGRFRIAGLLNRRRERREAQRVLAQLDVRTPSLETPVVALSGGNQQKVVLAKWLARGCRVLLIDEPTRGVDVGAKAAIHALIDDLACQGAAVLLISSELPEVLSLSRRVLVMREGRLVGELAREQATQERVLQVMAGV